MTLWLDLAPEPPLGTFIMLDSDDIVEIAASSGFHFVIIDREHGPKSWSRTTGMIRAAQAAGCVPLVRVERLDEVEIGHAVDAGAGGVVVPLVGSVEHVRRIVSAARYAPIGRKGACPASRNAEFGRKRGTFIDVTSEANSRFLLIGLIEDRSAINDLEAILGEAPGLDLVLLGRSDLAADVGRMGDIRHPEVVALVDRYRKVAGASGRGGMVLLAGEDPEPWIKAGMRLLVCGTDSDLIARTYADLVARFRPSV